VEYFLEIVKQEGWNIFLKWISKQDGISKQGRSIASRVEKTFKIVK
jgi:hypothetical protein